MPIYTVEYSVIQKCYHIDDLDRTLACNLEAVCKNINNGYLLIGQFPSHDLASDFVKRHRLAMSEMVRCEKEQLTETAKRNLCGRLRGLTELRQQVKGLTTKNSLI